MHKQLLESCFWENAERDFDYSVYHKNRIIIHSFNKSNYKHGTQFGISIQHHALCAQTKGYLFLLKITSNCLDN